MLASDAAVALCAAALAALLVWGGELASHKWANHDVANALYIGERMLEGERLYVDWLYFVMPSAMFLYTGACWAARALGLTPPTAVHLGVVALGLLGAWVIRRSLPASAARAVVTLAYLGILAHAGLAPVDFAQRDHIFALLLVPYLLWRSSERPASAPVLALAALLGCAATIKPSLLAALAVVEAFHLRDRGRRLAVWTALAAGAALPWAWLALHSPDSLAGFLEELVPYYAAGSYDAFDRPAARFLRGPGNRVLAALGLFLAGSAGFALARGVVPRRACALALATATLLYLSVFQQGKFFSYHQIPYAGVAWVLGTYFAVRAADSLCRPWLRRAVPVTLALLALAVVGRGTLELARLVRAGPTAHARPILPLLAGQRLVAIMSTSVEGDLFSYTFSHDLEVMGPWTSNYTVSSFFGVRDPGARRLLFERYFEPIAEKLRTEQPGLVLFSPFHQALPGRTTMHDVFVERYRLFPTPDYQPWRRTQNGWIVYRRVPERPPTGAGSVLPDR